MTMSRRDTVKSALALAALAPTGSHAMAASAAPAETAADALPSPAMSQGDYELSITITFDFQDYSAKGAGKATYGEYEGAGKATYGEYEVAGSREDGAWRMYVSRILAEDWEAGEHILDDGLLDVDGQTDGPDPLALLQALLGGHAVLDGTAFVRDLSQRQLAALRHASPALRAALLALMQRNGLSDEDAFATWFGRWALTASGRDLDGFRHSDPRYRELAALVKGERLYGKSLAEEADNLAAHAKSLAAYAAREE